MLKTKTKENHPPGARPHLWGRLVRGSSSSWSTPATSYHRRIPQAAADQADHLLSRQQITPGTRRASRLCLASQLKSLCSCWTSRDAGLRRRASTQTWRRPRQLSMFTPSCTTSQAHRSTTPSTQSSQLLALSSSNSTWDCFL